MKLRRKLKIALTVACILTTVVLKVNAVNYYVSAQDGSDTSDGLSITTAFESLQKAANLTEPGDTVFIMNGTYSPVSYNNQSLLNITRSGTREKYIVYKSLASHDPKIFIPSNLSYQLWDAVIIDASFIVFEGIEIMGNSVNISHEDAYQSWLDYENNIRDWVKIAAFNVNGISIGKNADVTNVIVRGCEIHHMPGGGVGGGRIDYITVENNLVYNSSWRTMYATSGISILTSYNSDESTDYKIFVRNNMSFGNKTLVPWNHIDKLSDGNGIIIDVNTGYVGRTLVENNVSYNNGGSGIHAYKSSHVDIINNTAYNNGTVVGYPEIYGQDGIDVQIYNNIMYAREGGACNSSASGTIYDYNIYFNGPAPVKGDHDLEADPKFIRLALDSTADFRLRSNSPAINSGSSVDAHFSSSDIDGVDRPVGERPDRGAYESEYTETRVIPEITVRQGVDSHIQNSGTYHFGDVLFNLPQTVAFTIENTGGSELILSGSPKVALSGDGYALISDAADTIAPNSKSTFKIQLTTTSEIDYLGQVQIKSNDPYDTLFVFTIIGTGRNPEKASQKITFNALPVKNIEDQDFIPPASSDSGLPVSFSSSNPSVATIIDGKVHVVGVGMTVLTASQEGDASTHPANDVQQTLTVTEVLHLTGSNLISNPSFDTNTTGWGLNYQNSGAATMASVAREGYATKVGRIEIPSSGTTSSDYNIQFGSGISVEKDKSYVVMFKASAEVVRSISLILIENSSPWRIPWSKGNINLTTIPTTFGPFEYNCEETQELVFRFLLGSSTATVYIDDVEIYEVDNSTASDSHLIDTNGITFEIYPNPATNKINIVFDGLFDSGIEASLVSLQGQTLARKSFFETSGIANTFQFDVNVPSGLYLLKLNSRKFSHTKPVIIRQ